MHNRPLDTPSGGSIIEEDAMGEIGHSERSEKKARSRVHDKSPMPSNNPKVEEKHLKHHEKERTKRSSEGPRRNRRQSDIQETREGRDARAVS